MEKKITKKEHFIAIATIMEEIGREDLVAVMAHEIELLSKRSGSTGKLTKAQQENEDIKAEIVRVLAETNCEHQIKDLTAMSYFANFSGQKMSALLTQLVNSGKIERIADKKKNVFFKIVATE